ncbi:MAG: hypothetical protein K0S01_2124 [Herbinix sp.]|jgi:hypothetical protein|nr:hypothetical protein [Herbinix sp.]
MLKKVLTFILILIGLMTISSFAYKYDKTNAEVVPFVKAIEKNNSSLPEVSTEKMCNDIIISLLFTHTQRAVDNFYSKYLKEIPGVDPHYDKVLSIERIGGESRHYFLIKVETMPYIGPHITVGRDHITFRLNALGEVTLEKFEHIESSKILPLRYPDIIKNWPPQ